MYLRRQQREELRAYQLARLEWAVTAPYSKRKQQPPEKPPILEA